ncbi:fructosamine kinase family protein [Flexivirga alba]|uniref:Fructosamine kinase family protein n=1 Tax=Flexivirga alba TaxID=702742 RepID=A0ABW2ABU4_9MICO
MSLVKHAASARAAEWEAAGLDWLRVEDGAAVVDVVAVDGNNLVLQQLSPIQPSVSDAEDFGRALAATHAAGAAGYGAGPDEWSGDGFQGPADDLLPLPLVPYDSWGAMYADVRLAPLLEQLAQLAGSSAALSSREARAAYRRVPEERSQAGRVPEERSGGGVSRPAEPLLKRLHDGEFDESCTAPARLHGDLWSGNVLWTADGAVLIDPAAHGGHPESDLAALALFGAPHLERILASYNEIAPLADGWRDRIPLMQLHLMLLHAVLFGGGYVEQAEHILRRYR